MRKGELNGIIQQKIDELGETKQMTEYLSWVLEEEMKNVTENAVKPHYIEEYTERARRHSKKEKGLPAGQEVR